MAFACWQHIHPCQHIRWNCSGKAPNTHLNLVMAQGLGWPAHLNGQTSTIQSEKKINPCTQKHSTQALQIDPPAFACAHCFWHGHATMPVSSTTAVTVILYYNNFTILSLLLQFYCQRYLWHDTGQTFWHALFLCKSWSIFFALGPNLIWCPLSLPWISDHHGSRVGTSDPAHGMQPQGKASVPEGPLCLSMLNTYHYAQPSFSASFMSLPSSLVPKLIIWHTTIVHVIKHEFRLQKFTPTAMISYPKLLEQGHPQSAYNTIDA